MRSIDRVIKTKLITASSYSEIAQTMEHRFQDLAFSQRRSRHDNDKDTPREKHHQGRDSDQSLSSRQKAKRFNPDNLEPRLETERNQTESIDQSRESGSMDPKRSSNQRPGEELEIGLISPNIYMHERE